jgi:FKBP-type peptidyl-prolyl cis-trans isomerase FkpA
VRKVILLLSAAIALVPSAMPQAANAPLANDDQKTVYAIGLSIYRSLAPLNLSPAELQIVARALSDAAANKPAVDLTMWGPKINAFAGARAAETLQHDKETAKAYLDKAAAQPGAVRTSSGLIYHEIRPGAGAAPKAADTVKVNYRGTLVNGSEFDSSYARNESAEFALNGVIPCWTEGLQLMKPGGKATLICPSDLAYGDNGHPPTIPGGATLIFDVELLGITPATPGVPAR